MNDYKLVPVEPTLDMLCEGTDVYGSEDCAETDVLGIYKAMLAAAPAVQGEPVAWVTADTVEGHTLNGKPRRIWWENNEGVGMPIYADPQPAEQQPDVTQLVEALECMIIGACAVAVPHNGERAVLQDAVNIARAALAAYRQGGEA